MACVPAVAEPHLYRELPADEFLRRFSDVTYEGVYPNGIGFTETLRADLTLSYADEDGASAGHAFAADGRLCFAYAVDPGPYCFIVWQRSANCYDGYTLRDPPLPSATALERVLGLSADVRFWRTDVPTTCDAAPTS